MRMGDSEGPHELTSKGKSLCNHLLPDMSLTSAPRPSPSSFLLLCWLALTLHLIPSLTLWVYLCLHPCIRPRGTGICGPFATYEGTLGKEQQMDPAQGPGRCNHSHWLEARRDWHPEFPAG